MSKKPYHKNEDPNLSREKDQYSHPVPSREYIMKYMDEIDRPVSWDDLLEAFELQHEEELEGLRRRLIAMQRDGQIMRNRRENYALVTKLPLVKGRIQANRDGSGYLIPENGEPDVYLPAGEMRQVFNDDHALVNIVQTKWKAREGRIIEVIKRNTQQLVGRFCQEKGVSFVDPNNKTVNQDILISAGGEGGAKVGQFVVVEITEQPTSRREAIGRVIDILGDRETNGIEVELAMRSYNLPHIWPQAVLQEAQSFAAEVPESESSQRENFRHLPFVTIDGADAKDFDDAVYCEPTQSGYILYVAIADVSHYVKPESDLDKEAEARGNSVYFPSKVLPMLPETLSNNLCSLRPKCDRLTLACVMEMDRDGEIQDFRFTNAVIHSQARLTYDEVAAMLKGEKTENHRMYKHLKPLEELYRKLIRQRELRGAIDFDTVETQIVFDDKGKIERIVPRVRNEAHRIIEEAMLAANVCAAKYIEKAGVPSLYRVHETPKLEKLNAFREFLKPFGLRLGGSKAPTTMDYAKLLERITKREDASLLQTVMLRSMQQAIYSPDNVGHFGLSYKGYTHFTSPIRRYPDLIVHRAIKFILEKKKKEKYIYNHADMERFGEHCSLTERRADKATRDATDWLKCEYMLDKLGKRYKGRIIDVTSFGVFVVLEEVFVQGLVHITALKNDYYQYEPTNHALRGKKSGKSYRLGDPIEVLVARVDLDAREINFELADDEPAKKKA